MAHQTLTIPDPITGLPMELPEDVANELATLRAQNALLREALTQIADGALPCSTARNALAQVTK